MYPLVPPDAVARGNVRAVSRGPSTVSEVLTRASAAMDAEDAAEAYARDPIRYIGVHRSRARLIDRLLQRRRT
jgi:hypothetical protein